MSIAIEVVSWWGMRGHRCDFLMYAYLIFPNAFELFLKVWPPECEVHDTNPVQLLSCKCCLPMDRVVGMSVWIIMNSRHLWLNSEMSWLQKSNHYFIRRQKCVLDICSIFPRYFQHICISEPSMKNEEPMDYGHFNEEKSPMNKLKSGHKWYDTCLI